MEQLEEESDDKQVEMVKIGDTRTQANSSPNPFPGLSHNNARHISVQNSNRNDSLRAYNRNARESSPSHEFSEIQHEHNSVPSGYKQRTFQDADIDENFELESNEVSRKNSFHFDASDIRKTAKTNIRN